MPKIPFARFAEEVTSVYRSGNARSTARKIAQALREFAEACAAKSTVDLTPANVAKFVAAVRSRPKPDGSSRSSNTVAGLTSFLRSACSYAERRHYVKSSPFGAWAGFDCLSLEAENPPVLSLEQIQGVLRSLGREQWTHQSGRLCALAAVYACTGMRRNEALFLRIADVDLKQRLIRVASRPDRRLKRKTAARHVPISENLLFTLRNWIPRCESADWLFPNRYRSGPWAAAAAGTRPVDRLRQAGVRAGVTDFIPSTLRRSFATLCATRWNVPPAMLQKWMGHTRIETTMRFYVHLKEAESLRASEVIRFDV